MLWGDPPRTRWAARAGSPPQHPPPHLPDVFFLCVERRKWLFPLSRAVPAFGRSMLALGCPSARTAEGWEPARGSALAEPGLETRQPRFQRHLETRRSSVRCFGGEELVCSPWCERGN